MWLFNTVMARVMFGRSGVQMAKNGAVWLLVLLVFADDLRIMIECFYSLSDESFESECSKECV